MRAFICNGTQPSIMVAAGRTNGDISTGDGAFAFSFPSPRCKLERSLFRSFAIISRY